VLPDVEVVPDIVAVPAVAPVAVVADPIAIPPPSYVSIDPMSPDGDVPNVEHVVPLPGNATVPVEWVGSGLTPADGISVAPSRIPVPPIDVVESIPSGEVGLIGAGMSSST
jgi:hypothetical protein